MILKKYANHNMYAPRNHHLINGYQNLIRIYHKICCRGKSEMCESMYLSTFLVWLNKSIIHISKLLFDCNWIPKIVLYNNREMHESVNIYKVMQVELKIKNWKRKMLCFNFDNNCKWIWLNKNKRQNFMLSQQYLVLALTNV